jgi:transcriptional regulator GlxA family with amidase domain
MDTPATWRMLRRWKPHGLIGGPSRQAGVPVATPLAPLMGVSRRAMERRFRRELGVSPRRMIERVRLRTAMHLLRITTLSVDQVAERSGFPSNARLFSVFRRTMRMTPRAYRTACHAQG